MASELIKLSDYSLESLDDGNGLKKINLVLSKGEVFSIEADARDDARLLLRGMASLEPPKSGQFFHKGKKLDFSDYRSLLAYKKNVGYIASDATLITNRSVHDNLMLMRYYFENSTSIQMSEEVIDLCRAFKLGKRFDLRPHQLDPEQNRLFVIVRELSKNPEILLVERPREFLRTKSFETLKGVFRDLISRDLAVVFFSTDEVFTKEFSQRPISINKGRVII